MSKIEIINEKPYIKSFWDNDAQCYVNEWHGIVEKEEFKEAVMVGFDFMIENNVKVHLADARDMRTGWTGAEEWLYSFFWPKLVENGLTHFGIILPHNAFLEFASYQMEKQMKDRGITLVYQAFENMESAKKWSAAIQDIVLV